MFNRVVLSLAFGISTVCAFTPLMHGRAIRHRQSSPLEMASLAPSVVGTSRPYSPSVVGRKEKVVVLGTGWASVKFAQNIDTTKFDVTVVSPRNFFLFTPFLPATVVGTVEPRSIVEPIRSLLEYDARPFTRKIKDRVSGISKEKFQRCKFLEAAAIDIDYENNKVKCADISEFVGASDDSFDLEYDQLVIAVGATSNTFGTPGVKENAIFLKEIDDALKLRNKLADLFETAAIETDPEVKREMLQICVVGGGPTGVESAVEIDDYIRDDLGPLYPDEVALTKIFLIEAADDILSSYQKEVSEFTREIMKNSAVDVITKTFVTKVNPDSIELKTFSGETSEIKSPLVLWSTGVTATPLVKSVMDSVPEQTKRNALETDRNMRVKGLTNVYSLGDCATVVDSQLLMDSAADLYRKADLNNDGSLDFKEIRTLLDASSAQYPQVNILLQQMASDKDYLSQFSEKKIDELNEAEFTAFIKSADDSIRGLPPTAQVAGQQGSYLAGYMNRESDKPFKYFHKGSMAYLGQGKAAAQVSVLASLLPYGVQDILPAFGQDIVLTGDFAELVWKILYVDMLVSPRNKVQVLFDWFKTEVFGRDTSRF